MLLPISNNPQYFCIHGFESEVPVRSPNMNLISMCRHWLDPRNGIVIHGNVIVSGERVRDTRNTFKSCGYELLYYLWL
jgi:hypothetical protein